LTSNGGPMPTAEANARRLHGLIWTHASDVATATIALFLVLLVTNPKTAN
jgi:hypothetical protein